MQEIQTRSTSLNTAECSPIPLRVTDRVRLAFLPTLVNNEKRPEACVNGAFVYQRKGSSEEWGTIRRESLATLKRGEGFVLQLHAAELLDLINGLRPLYRLHKEQGIPRGTIKYVRMEAGLARFLDLGQDDLKRFLDEHQDDAATTLLKILRWLATSPNAATKLSSVAFSELPSVGALLGLSTTKGALRYWEQNRTNSSEDFWQKTLAERAYVLSQAFAYPVLVIREKAYVGGKRLDNKHGNVVDFLAKIESTDNVVLIEIKTPTTKLLGPEYRDGAFPLSPELSGAIAQVLRYRQSLMSQFHSLVGDSSADLTLGEPRCMVIAGDTKHQLTTIARRESFELLRERIQGVTLITYDELFHRLHRLVALLEASVET
jgi:Domain of unknown function (DUF4263)